MSPVGMQSLDIIECTEMNRIFLAIPSYDYAHPGETGRVNGISAGSQIERRLDEAAVILQTNIDS